MQRESNILNRVGRCVLWFIALVFERFPKLLLIYILLEFVLLNADITKYIIVV